MSQAITVPTMDPTAPMMKAPKVLLAALNSLQHDHSAISTKLGRGGGGGGGAGRDESGIRVGSRWVMVWSGFG